MSCSTTSLTANTTKNTFISEDPYVFTETVPTTPPILFNNSQKSRSRLVVKELSVSQTFQEEKVQKTNTEPALNKAKSYGFKTQTPSSGSIKNAPFSNSAVLGVLNTNKIKYGPQSPKNLLEFNQAKHMQQVLLTHNENSAATTFVAGQTASAIANTRNVQQHKQQLQKQQNYQQHQQKKSQTPMSLSHTPSLWQTPLLLDNSPAVDSSSTTAISTTLVKDGTTATTCVSSFNHAPLQISFQPPTPTLAATALITPITIPAVSTASTAPASMAPLQLIMPSATPLPPSNFHNTTLAQHLQKVQCLKNSKKSNPLTVTNICTQKPEVSSSPTPHLQPPSKIPTQHSTTDLNEIPVNVIFRSPTKTNEIKSNSNKGSVNSVISCDDNTEKSQISMEAIASKKKFLEIGSLAPKQSSKPSQKRKYSNLPCDESKTPSHVPQSKLCKLQKSSITRPEVQKLPTNEVIRNIHNSLNSAPLKSGMDAFPAKPQKSVAKRKTIGTGQKIQKRNRKVGPYTNIDSEGHQTEFSMSENTSSALKAVAVVRLPHKKFEDDDSMLAEDSVLPYCVQRHWFNVNDHSTRLTAVCREERIIEYKNVLRRQAMQLLSTRSLQRLARHITRKRLLCVDTLLRKYRDHNRTVVGKITRQCDAENCEKSALEMATYCQKHIIKNTKQCIFVQCSAKNLKDDQKLCDVPVLNIQKSYSVPLCFIHTAHHSNDANNAKEIIGVKQGNSPYITTKINSNRKVSTSRTTPSCKRKTLTTHVKSLHNLPNTNVVNTDTLPLSSEIGLTRKSSSTSLESIASNSLSSFASTIQTQKDSENMTLTGGYKEQNMNENTFQGNMLSPPLLAPLSYNINSVHNHKNTNGGNLSSDHSNSSHRDDNIFGSGTLDSTAEQEINKLVAQFAMAAAAAATPTNINNSCNNNNNNSFNYMNTNSNSNLTSSGVGSSSSLPSTDELLTQDMLTDYASSSEDTGLGELSENELIGASGGCGSGLNEDDVSPDEIPLGDTRLLEENDLVNVFGTLPVNLNELFTTVVRQDEQEEVERALEIADKHLRTLQQTIGSDSDFLADFLNVNDDMLADTDDICSKMEIVSSVLSPPESLDAATMYLENTDNVLNVSHSATTNASMSPNCVGAGTANSSSVVDIRELLQT